MGWEATLALAVRAIKIFESLDVSRRIDRVKIDGAIQTLKQIFFYSSELTLALEEIEAGRMLDTEVASYFADEFRSVPNHIQHSLEFIDRGRFEEGSSLRIADIELMNQIRHGKINTRHDVSKFFQAYIRSNQDNKLKFAEDATRILGQIARLNSAIEKLETRLMRSQVGAVTSGRSVSTSHSRKRIE